MKPYFEIYNGFGLGFSVCFSGEWHFVSCVFLCFRFGLSN
jgi:hypothetical protein